MNRPPSMCASSCPMGAVSWAPSATCTARRSPRSSTRGWGRSIGSAPGCACLRSRPAVLIVRGGRAPSGGASPVSRADPCSGRSNRRPPPRLLAELIDLRDEGMCAPLPLIATKASHEYAESRDRGGSPGAGNQQGAECVAPVRRRRRRRRTGRTCWCGAPSTGWTLSRRAPARGTRRQRADAGSATWPCGCGRRCSLPRRWTP